MGQAPRFLIRALRDPDGANLDRIQVVKGWLDADGKTQERIFDVAVSDGREIDAEGRCKTPVGSTVDIENASYTNSIGEPLLGAYWEDLTFDPKQRALLLRARDRDPEAALDRLRPEVLRHQDARGHEADGAGPGLHLPDLVHAPGLNRFFISSKAENLSWTRKLRSSYWPLVFVCPYR